MRRLAVGLVAAVLAASCHVTSAAPSQRTVEDDLVALTLDAEGEDFDVLSSFLASRGTAAVAALRRAAQTEEPQRAWLADALADMDDRCGSHWPRRADRGTPARVPPSPPPDSHEPSDPPPPPSDAERFDRRDDVVNVIWALKGLGATPDLARPEPDAFRPPRESNDVKPHVDDRHVRCEALLQLADSAAGDRSSPGTGAPPLSSHVVDPERVVPWIEHLVDDAELPSDLRFGAAKALVRFRTPDAASRLLRAIDETRFAGDDVGGLLGPLAATGAPEAARFLLRLQAQLVHVRDGGDVEAASKALAAMRRDAPAAVATAEADTLVLFRRYEAESPPMRHSTGVAVDGGWSVRRGRDGAQHALYGPYVDDLPSRRFVARFRFRIDALRDHDGDEDVLWFDAMSLEMERHGWRDAAKAVRRKDVRLGEWQEADVAFWTHPKPAKMEFRTYWDGRCDAVIDRVDLLDVRPESPQEHANWPIRTPSPWTPRAAPVRLLPATAALLFDEAARRRGVRYRALRDALLSDPVAARPALEAAAGANNGSDRSWLADVLLARLASPDEFARVRSALDDAMSALERVDRIPGWMNEEPSPCYAFFRRDLETGRCAIRIDGAPRTAEGVTVWVGAAPARGGLSRDWYRRSIEGVVRPLPASPLWPAVFAETWLTEPLPPPLPRKVDRNVAPPPFVEESSLDVPPFSTVGHRRLHAMQQLAWLGEKRIRPAALRLRDDADATVSERAVAARRLRDLGE